MRAAIAAFFLTMIMINLTMIMINMIKPYDMMINMIN